MTRSLGELGASAHPASASGRRLLLEAIDTDLEDLEGRGNTDDWADPLDSPVDVARFLEAFQALLYSIEQAYENFDEPVPDDPWAVLATVMRGARYYE